MRAILFRLAPRASGVAFLLFVTLSCQSSGVIKRSDGSATLAVRDLRLNGMSEPLGLAGPPRVSWRLESTLPGTMQTAYQVVAATTPEGLYSGEGRLWDSGKVKGSQAAGVPWAGAPLSSRQRGFAAVRVWDQRGNVSPLSAPAPFELGLLAPGDWTAKWIGASRQGAAADPAAPLRAASWVWAAGEDARNAAPVGHRYFRNEFTLPAGGHIQHAVLWVGANDSAEVFVNGKKVTSGSLSRLATPVDVAAQLRPGRNVVAADVHNTGGPAGLLLALELTTAEGGTFAIHTGDVGWQAAARPGADWQQVGEPSGFGDAEVIAKFGAPPFAGRPQLPAWAAPAPYLYSTFSAPAHITRARAYVAGLGYYELYLNGRRVGDHVLEPPFSDYDKTVEYTVFDVTRLLEPRNNGVGIILGNGYYNQHAADVWNYEKAPWRDEPKVRVQIEALTETGERFVVASDGTWKAADGPIRFDGLRNGEHYDARLERPGFATAGFEAPGARPVREVGPPRGRLVPREAPPIRVTETLEARSVQQVAAGVHLFDLGQNIAGWARLRVQGPTGTKLTLRFGEKLGPDGRLDRKALEGLLRQGVFEEDQYILRGGPEEVWEPRFTYHGFRYVEVEGFPGTPPASAIEGRVVHTDFASVGHFETSDALVNRIHAATCWSYRSNYVGIPTDCPHREKNGWTGDAHLAIDAGLFNFDNAAAYLKWIRDLTEAQSPKGTLPGIVPSPGWGYEDKWSGPAWDAALFVVPWSVYKFTGDRTALMLAFGAQQKYLASLEARAPEGLVDFGLGDWSHWKTQTPVAVTSTAAYHLMATLAAKTAGALGQPDLAKRYTALADKISQAFQRAFVNARTGQVADDQQTALALALLQGLVPETLRPAVVQRLVASVEKTDFHPDTGVLGAGALLRALSKAGHADVAFKVANRRTAPGWGHWIDQGATTLWETWSGESSRNHVFFGDIDAWYYEVLAGIQPDDSAPGFAHVTLAPEVVPELDRVEASVDTVRGKVLSRWEREGDSVRFAFEVPTTVRATLRVPAAPGARVTLNGRAIDDVPGLGARKLPEGGYSFEAGPGRYAVVAGR
ncbi:MAG: family 78 glycoside hydrolase catalytic domain [Myxococcales bacterium]|nr:family 78 glycoside hydrolase catalytic domain [Myxococcales bacterium]